MNQLRADLIMNPKPPTIYSILNSIANYDSEEKTKIRDLAKVTHEIELFDECFEKMQGGKHIIKVNVEGDNLNYRNIEDIYNEIISKLNKMGITL